MAINFPSNPTNAQEITEGNVTYVYNATKGYWESSEVSSGASIDVLADMAALIAKTGMSNGDQAFVTGNNNLYIYSGTGWYKIATVQNDSPTAITGVSGSYSLETDGTPTVITAVSTDPEGFPLTWSYSTSGLGSIATVSQADNVFTITPSTNDANIGTFTLTINATDGVNGAVSANTSITLEFIIANSNYTTLLATAVDTSDNNNITDSSSNNHTITVTGDAHAGTFSPYRHGGYSTYFDGSGDWLELTGTALGNGDFTVEAWVWLDSLKDYNVIYDDRATGSSATGLALGVMSTGAPYLYTNNGFQITSSQTCTANTWHHISLVRSSGVITIYLDGTSGGTYSSSANFTDTNLGIGVARTYTVTSQFGGYIRDVRAVVGSAITPASGGPTIPLTAVTNTKLLTCHLPYFKDGSSNAHAITVNGNTSTKPFGPYDYYNEYSATDHGGSVYFDGTGDLLTITNDAALDFGTGDFTIEAWVYNTGTDYFSIWQNAPVLTTTDTSRAFFGIQATNGSVSFARHAGGGSIVTSSNVAPKNQWNHVVLVRDSTSVRIYVNGVEEASTTDTALTSYGFGQHTITVGYRITPNYGQGYISDLKTVKGTALYTANFTPPTVPLTATSGTGLLLSGTDASIIDKSQTSNLQLVGNTTGSTTQVKFADTKSMYFDGNADEIAYTVPTLSGDFTFEAFIYPESQIQSFPICFTSVWDATVGNRIVLSYDTSTDVDKFSCRVGSNFIVPSSTSSTGQWYHVAVVRSGSTVSMYIDGIRIGTQTYSGSISSRTGYIGGNISNSTGGAFKGYIQDFRFTKGLARYTADFTPPTKPLKG